MVLAVLGLNHKTVSVDIREKFSISEESAREGLLHLSEQEGIKEAVVLSTCNRTEIYAVLKEEEDKEELYRFFLTLSGNSKAEKEYFFFIQVQNASVIFSGLLQGLIPWFSVKARSLTRSRRLTRELWRFTRPVPF